MPAIPSDDRHASSPLRTPFGQFLLHAFVLGGLEHMALVFGSPAADPYPLVRVQSSCVTGSALLSELCDCRQQLHAAMSLVVDEGSGVVLYLDQEGRSHGLVEKVAQLDLIARGADTVQAARMRGKGEDLRDYADVAVILRELIGDRPIRCLTNNPMKLAGIEQTGVRVAERLALETEPTEGNVDYLRVKKLRMGHLLARV